MIGIFKGTKKKVEYNKLVLKALLFGDKTTKEVAEYIYHNRAEQPQQNDTINKENNVKNIVSVISHRKERKGRLWELEMGKYIFRENSLWQLRFKGMCVALTQLDSVVEVFPSIVAKDFMRFLEKDAYSKSFVRKALKATPDKKSVQKLLDFGKSPSYFQFLKDETNKLIAQGVDLDGYTDNELSTMMASKAVGYLFRLDFASRFEQLQHEYEQFLKEEGKKP